MSWTKFVIFFIVGIVSSDSTRKLKCPGSAQLGSFIARLEPENSSSGSSLIDSLNLPFGDSPDHKALKLFNKGGVLAAEF